MENAKKVNALFLDLRGDTLRMMRETAQDQEAGLEDFLRVMRSYDKGERAVRNCIRTLEQCFITR